MSSIAEDRCHVCRLPLAEERIPLMQLPCGHKFHMECGIPLYQSGARCPVCDEPEAEEERSGTGCAKLDLARAVKRDPNPSMTVVVKCIDRSGPFSFRMSPSDLVGHLRFAIAKEKGTPASLQKLLYNSGALDPLEPLSRYGIRDGDAVHLVFNLTGGKPVICFQSPTDEIGFTFTLAIPSHSKLSAAWPLPDGDRKAILAQSFRWTMNYSAQTNLMNTVLADNGIQCPYIFYEFETQAKLELRPDHTSVFSAGYRMLTRELENIAAREGLDAKNRADFVTWWLPQMLKPDEKPALFAIDVLRDGDYAELVPLAIEVFPRRPVRVHRFFMLWKKQESAGDIVWRTIDLPLLPLWNATAGA